MKLTIVVGRRTAQQLRALAAEFGCSERELAAEGLRAFVSAAPRRRQRRSAAASAPLRGGVSAAPNPLGLECVE